jgi:hypothetical protein
MCTEFDKLSDREVITCYSLAIQELRNRNIIRTKNITGELGEYIAVDFYRQTPTLPNLQFAPTSTENIDAISTKGERYSIKTITNNGATGVFYGLPPLGSNEESMQKFEYVIIVKLTDDFELERILELSWEEFVMNKKWHSRMKAWNLSYSKKLINSVRTIYSKED